MSRNESRCVREYETAGEREARVRQLTDGLGTDVGIEVADVPDAFAEGIRLLRDGGRYLEMGNVSPGHTTEFDPGLLTRKSIDITSTVRYDPWYLHRALAFLDANSEQYPYADLIDAEFALREIDEALAKSDSREVTRATLIPEHAQ